MRKLIALLPAVALATSLMAQAPLAPKGPFAVPRPAGEFVVHMVDGSQKLLSSYKGKVVVMPFMFTTCTHCQHTAGVLAKVETEYAGKGVQVLGVTIDPGAKEGIPAFLKITGANFPVGYSAQDQALKFLHAPADGWYVPMLAFIDQSGMVRSEYVVMDPGDASATWLANQEVNIRKELDALVKPKSPISRPAAKKASKP